MVRFQENFPLKRYHTFGTDASALFFYEFTEARELPEFLNETEGWDELPLLILGEGSNLLFLNNFEGLVIHPNIPGLKVVHEDRNHVWLEAGAGVSWDELVHYCVYNEWGGVENLSLIPGKVGASAVQNIGAYGVEVCGRIESVTGFDLKTMQEYCMQASDCRYGYRDSIFKHELKGRFIVTSVTFKLDKFPEFKLKYGDLAAEVEKLGGPSLWNIRQAVISIRESKLPDPKVTGNAGSFFMNPVVSAELANQIKASFPEIPVYPEAGGQVKLAAGWLIDQCGWKGFRRGDAGVHPKQALVLVNYGNATGREIYELSEEIRQSVLDRFGVELHREVNVIE